jgi:sugar phosphate isomerase/epimerase
MQMSRTHAESMTEPCVTRRELLKAGAFAASCATASSAWAADARRKAVGDLTIGMATNDFRTHTNAQLAKELAAEGVSVVQLFLTQTDSNYWKYNSRSDLAGLTAERCREIADTYRSAGLSIHSIGVYTNLIHPDPAERKANLAYFEAMMKVGDSMNVRAFITEAGHYYDPDKPAPRVEHHFQEEVWKMMVGVGKELAKMAEAYNATVLFEPFYRHFLASAKRTRVYLEEIGSPRLRALLDPANLLEVNDLDEMFDQLTPWIDCLHAKDRKLHVDRGVPAGQGDLDYRKFVTLAARRTPHAPLVLEYVGAKDYKQALAHLRQAIRASSSDKV